MKALIMLGLEDLQTWAFLGLVWVLGEMWLVRFLYLLGHKITAFP